MPETFFATPIPQIELALKGKVDFVIKTNPFGGGEDKSKTGPKGRRSKGGAPLTEDGELDRKEVSRQVSLAFRAMGAKRAKIQRSRR